jgi:HEAT repeat protein
VLDRIARVEDWLNEKITAAAGWGILLAVLLRMGKRQIYEQLASGEADATTVAAHRNELIEALERSNSFGRISAAHDLARELPHPDPIAEAALRRALNDEEEFVRSAAASALIEIDDRRDPEPIVSALRRAESRRTGSGTPEGPVTGEEIARFHLGRLRNIDPIPKLLDVLSTSDDPWLRRFAASELGWTEGDPDVTQALVEAVRGDADAGVRNAALFALDDEDERASTAYVWALSDDAEKVRETAARSLDDLRDERSRRALLGALEDPSARVMKAAAHSLVAHGPQARAELVEAIQRRPTWKRKRLRRALRILDRHARRRAMLEARMQAAGAPNRRGEP